MLHVAMEIPWCDLLLPPRDTRDKDMKSKGSKKMEEVMMMMMILVCWWHGKRQKSRRIGRQCETISCEPHRSSSSHVAHRLCAPGQRKTRAHQTRHSRRGPTSMDKSERKIGRKLSSVSSEAVGHSESQQRIVA